MINMSFTLAKQNDHQKQFLVRYFRMLHCSAVVWADSEAALLTAAADANFDNELPTPIRGGRITSTVDTISVPLNSNVRALRDGEAIKENPVPDTPTMAAVRAVLDELFDLIQSKNAAYGDAALNPLRVFSKNLSVEDMLRVRMDDKLSRLSRGAKAGEDPEWDLFGYLVLMFANRKRQAQEAKQPV